MASRGAVEAKPPWRQVPWPVRERTEARLGAPVTRAARVYGGYAPSATFRLRLADGRGAFFKGAYPLPEGSAVHFPLDREERVYERLRELISPWAPAYLGSFRESEWHVVLLEDVGPATVPPWTAAKSRAAMRGFGEFHRGTLGRSLPRWLEPVERSWRFSQTWQRLGAMRGGRAGLAGLAGPRAAEAAAWLRRNVPALDAAAQRLAHARGPHALLHLDTRSDNIRVNPAARVPLRIFDWPFACVGPPELDFAAFAQSVVCEGGPTPERLTRWYREEVAVRKRVLAGSVAAVAGFFALRAWQPPPEGLPRLRSIQRRQLKASLAWAARLLDLPAPAWLGAVPD